MGKQLQGIGLMSGSSLDGLDVAAIRFEWSGAEVTEWTLMAAQTLAYEREWVERLRKLPQSSALQLAEAHTGLARWMFSHVQKFLAKNKLQPDFIASHGHTVFHYPKRHLSVQIGDGATLSALTRLPVVCDFRTQDVALGGEGTPLAPMADRMLYPGYDFYLNIGGIANISSPGDGPWVAFDIGPANQILNGLAMQAGKAFDEDGKLAAGGQVDPGLLEKVNAHPFFGKPYPKSLDNSRIKEEFWPIYERSEAPINNKLATACVQLANQTHLSIRKIIRQERFSRPSYRMLVTGGGAFNDHLIRCLRVSCREERVEVIVPGSDTIEYKEAILMALLGLLRLERHPNVMHSVTGAERDTIGGAVYRP